MKEIKFRAWDIGEKKMIYGIDKMKEYYEGIFLIDELLNPIKARIKEIKKTNSKSSKTKDCSNCEKRCYKQVYQSN